MKIPAQYRGREQAYFKHCLLEAYLERLFMIIGQHQRTICYVDCFAGPWKSQADDLEDTSIVISLNLICKCREALQKIGKNVQFRALYVEEKPRRFKNLQAYITARPADGTVTNALQGKFHELHQEILDWCGSDSFVFFFIDPTGWKNVVELPTLELLLKRPNSEFLINFMYDFLSRTVPQPEFQEDMERIFGLVPDTEGMTPKEREAYLLELYRNNLMSISPASDGQPRTVCVPVLYPTKDRTLYNLVYLTHHPKGIVVFMEASEKLEFWQQAIRAEAKQDKREQRSKQIEMFSAEEQANGKRIDRDLTEVKKYWLTLLSTEPSRFGIRELADMLENTKWFPMDFQGAFAELAKEGKVRNLDAKRARPVNVVNFDKNEALVRVEP